MPCSKENLIAAAKWRAKNKEKHYAAIAKWKAANPEKEKIYAKTNYKRHRAARIEAQSMWYQNNREAVLMKTKLKKDKDVATFIYYAAKSRAKKKGIEFAIDKSDIVVPAVCPIFGIELKHGGRDCVEYAPSLDRKNPNLGYVKGNVWVISHRANRAKNNLTKEEITKLLAHLNET